MRGRGDQSSLKLAQKATTVIKVCIVVVSRISTVTRGGGRPICQPHYYHGHKSTHIFLAIRVDRRLESFYPQSIIIIPSRDLVNNFQPDLSLAAVTAAHCLLELIFRHLNSALFEDILTTGHKQLSLPKGNHHQRHRHHHHKRV